MTERSDHVTELLAAYVLGMATADELAIVEAHVDACVVCREELDELRADTALLAHAVPRVEPPAALRASILDSVDVVEEVDGRPAPPQERIGRARRHGSAAVRAPRRRRWAMGVLGTAACALLTAGVVAQSVRLGDARDELAAAERRDSGWNEPFGLRDATSIGTSGTLAAARARVALVDGADDAVLQLASVPQPPSGTTWQAWVISRSGEMTSIGTVDHESRIAVLAIPPVLRGDVGAVAVTLERSGGARQPTTDPVAYGTVRI